MTPDEFISAIKPAALVCESKSGIPHAVTIAQGALESAWGKSDLAVRGFNLFGVKANPTWTGRTLILPTREYLNGKWVTVQAKWRRYANWQECIDDHALFFHHNQRYKKALQTQDPQEFARRIATAGYATDPNYAEKLIQIMKGRNLI